MKKIILCFLAIILIPSCIKSNRELNKEIENITIDIKNNIQLPLDSLIENVEYIKLETNAENLIGKISQLFFTDSLIIVIDAESSKTISIFDIDGKFKRKIGRIGNGPEEFVEISNVVYVPNNNLISVLDRPQKKILYYDLNGDFIRYERQPFSFLYYDYLKSGNKAYDVISMYDEAYGKNKGKALIVTDSMNHIIYGALEDTYRTDFTYIINRPLRKYGSQLFFCTNLTDSIYIIENDSVIPKYYINIKDNSMHLEDKDHITNERLDLLMRTHFFFNGDFVELEDFTFINIATPWSYPFAIYSHNEKEVYLTTGKFYNPLYSFMEYEPISRYKDNGIVYSIFPYELIDGKKAIYDNYKNYENILNDLYEGLEIDSNPVLFIYSLNTNLGKNM